MDSKRPNLDILDRAFPPTQCDGDIIGAQGRERVNVSISHPDFAAPTELETIATHPQPERLNPSVETDAKQIAAAIALGRSFRPRHEVVI
jgi:hypothetical protein